ncbi:MAG TPA: glycosyltransferase [Thermoplasmata archaeon]|nr:glycosyltransferase [Thermoplasmata archaeon]
MTGTWSVAGPAEGTWPRNLAAGIVAHNEEHHLGPAVRSLLEQELPDGVSWGEVWVVASGCTDGTVGVAQALAREDPRVRLVVELDRGGKARALGEVFRRATGDALVLLNSDAKAEPLAVDQLVRTAAGKAAPYAVMARPVVPTAATGRWAHTMRWMWDLHHKIHAESLAEGQGSHLSDELLMLSLASTPQIPEGVINDGAYLAVWLSQHEGGRWYCPAARVRIQIPDTVRDYLYQRRRIHVGNGQIASILGVAPSSVPRQFLDRPGETVRILRRMIAREDGLAHFARIAVWELAAHALAIWDRLPPRADHVHWHRIRTPSAIVMGEAPGPTGSVAASSKVPTAEDRVASLLTVAGTFGTGVPLGQLRELLPSSGPESVEALRSWLEERPGLARLDGQRAFAPTAVVTPAADRMERARQYRKRAEALWDGPLSFAQDLVRCGGITGSVAFGEPRPGDDLDLFVVTRSGSLWWFLARSYLALLLARRRDPTLREPTPCLNYVLEDGPVTAEFARHRDLLFAREALTVQMLRGDDYYRGLVASAPWMRSELPRLYGARSGAPGAIAPLRASLKVQLLNLVVFPFLAGYLQLAGLARNSKLRHRGMPERGFRTETSRRRLVFSSRRFERLREQYATPAAAPAVRETVVGTPGSLVGP